jgi:hypothetical protein
VAVGEVGFSKSKGSLVVVGFSCCLLLLFCGRGGERIEVLPVVCLLLLFVVGVAVVDTFRWDLEDFILRTSSSNRRTKGITEEAKKERTRIQNEKRRDRKKNEKRKEERKTVFVHGEDAEHQVEGDADIIENEESGGRV